MKLLALLALTLPTTLALASEEGVIAMKDAKQLNVCSRIQDQLQALQEEGLTIENKAFNAASDKLKAHYSSLCESTDYDNGKLASVERDLDQLDQSLAYLNILTAKRKGSPKILNPFLKRHNNVCAPGCGYVSWGIWGDSAHQNRASCHNSGDAIDIHAITCGGTTYTGKSQKFRDYVSCMHNEFGTVFGNKTHTDHVHVQLRPCRRIYGTLQFSAAGYVDDTASLATSNPEVKDSAPAASPKASKPVVAKAAKKQASKKVARRSRPAAKKATGSNWTPWDSNKFWE